MRYFSSVKIPVVFIYEVILAGMITDVLLELYEYFIRG